MTEHQPGSAFEHLQLAAAEMFAAAHATLDSLEEMVASAGLGKVVAGVGKLAETLLDTVGAAMSPAGTATAADDGPVASAPGRHRPGVEHIPVD